MQARYFVKRGQQLQCTLCPHTCIIPKGAFGLCNVRQHIDGTLITHTYGTYLGMHIDPIEKKPLYHVLPSSPILSIGSIGCNLSCQWCQNASIATQKPILPPKHPQKILPEHILQEAQDIGLLAFTYNEPTVFFEFMEDVMVGAHEKGIKSVLVSNGFIEQKPLKKIIPYLLAANIDYKGTDALYKKYCRGSLKPVLQTLETLHDNNVWVEITNLLIPGLNDSREDIQSMCKWISTHLGKHIPLHLSAFYPAHHMNDMSPTPVETLIKAKRIADTYLDFVYLGNVEMQTPTRCTKCSEILIERARYRIRSTMKNNRCPHCQTLIPGIWK